MVSQRIRRRGRARCFAVPRHNPIGVAEITQSVAVAITDLAQLAVVVIAISDQSFERLITDDTFDLGKATEWVVVVQMHAQAPGRAYVS
jgi:hypothetical protein